MAKVSPFLKWLAVAAVVLVMPWSALLVAAYVLWRSGALGRARLAAAAGIRRAGIADAIFRLRLRSGAGLTEISAKFGCHTAGALAPFVVTRSGAGCRLVSAVRVSDSACSPEGLQLGVSEAMRVLRAAGVDFCVSLKYSEANGFQNPECTMVIAAECSGVLPLDTRTAGAEAMERASAVSRAVEGAAPALRAEVLRGRRILESVQAGELMRP